MSNQVISPISLKDGKQIRVSREIYEYLSNQGKKSETFDTILRKCLKIETEEK